MTYNPINISVPSFFSTGDVGFDPVGFSNNPPRPWLIGGEGRSLKWYREAEIVHGRVAMLAALGWVFPNIYHLPGNEDVSYIRTVLHSSAWQSRIAR